MAENNRDSEDTPVREKNTARTNRVYISVISFVLLILVLALPLMPEKDNEKTEKPPLSHAEKKALSRLEYFINDMDEDMAVSLSAKKSTDNVELPEVTLDNIRNKETQNSAESKVIPRKAGTLSLVYTVQAGSFNDLQSARKLYDSIVNNLTTEDLAYLRIEKVGQYYVVRIGKFGERSDAEIFHKKIGSQLSTAMIMQAYIREERIKKLHSS